jgi:hypothetical protein
VAAFRRNGRAQVAGVRERVNELAVARQILADDSLSGANLLYEPEIVTGGTRFDFVATRPGEMPLYIEVKTVEPQNEDNETNWEKVEWRQKFVTPGVRYYLDKQWMGAAIFNNSFSARASFLNYAIETEAKLKDHNAIQPGHAVLVFCGNGWAWHLSELEDFADFYRNQRHRLDDPFAKMERYDIQNGGGHPSYTLDGFAAMIRQHHETDLTKWVCPVRGPN